MHQTQAIEARSWNASAFVLHTTIKYAMTSIHIVRVKWGGGTPYIQVEDKTKFWAGTY